LWVVGAACAMAPDCDVLGFRFGIRYGDLFGHRGFTHSIFFAALLATVALGAVALGNKTARQPRAVWLYLFLATGLHGFFDALTNGGLGIAFFAPFDNSRYFFPWQPIEVSPFGAAFFSARGVEVLMSELVWVWLPAAAFVALALIARQIASRRLLAG
jgi:inner membrane protein